MTVTIRYVQISHFAGSILNGRQVLWIAPPNVFRTTPDPVDSCRVFSNDGNAPASVAISGSYLFKVVSIYDWKQCIGSEYLLSFRTYNTNAGKRHFTATSSHLYLDHQHNRHRKQAQHQ